VVFGEIGDQFLSKNDGLILSVSDLDLSMSGGYSMVVRKR